MKNATRTFVVTLAALTVIATSSCKRHKPPAPEEDAGSAAAVDAGDGDGGAAGADAGAVVDAGAAAAALPSGPDDAAYLVVSGPVERDAGGAWKLGVELAPAPPGQREVSAPAAASQIKVQVSSATQGTTTTDIPTQFDMQGIKAIGPLAEGTSGTIMPTTIRVPSDAVTLSIIADGKTTTTLLKKPKSVAIQNLKAKPGNGVVDVSFAFDPKAPASWVLYLEKRTGEWVEAAAGDDTKTTASVPPDVDSTMADVGVRLDVTDGFVVVTQVVRSPRPPEAAAAADAGSPILVDDGGP